MSDRWNNDLEADNSSGSILTYKKDPRGHQVAHSSNKLQGSNEQAVVRSRWTPKPEQILILESVFSSGMVNPPKDETVKIRKLLENFGPVGDANVFYWFQNRRSRSRRRQRQMLAANMEAKNAQNTLQYCDQRSNYNINPTNNMITPITSIPPDPFFFPSSLETLNDSASSSSTCLDGGFSSISTVEGFLLSADHMGFQDIDDNGSHAMAASSFLPASDVTSDLQYLQPGGAQGGIVTVFINGVPTEVPMGPLDMSELCGQDFFLVHSSGHPVPVNEYGFSTYSLQHGESYFLVAKST